MNIIHRALVNLICSFSLIGKSKRIMVHCKTCNCLMNDDYPYGNIEYTICGNCAKINCERVEAEVGMFTAKILITGALFALVSFLSLGSVASIPAGLSGLILASSSFRIRYKPVDKPRNLW